MRLAKTQLFCSYYFSEAEGCFFDQLVVNIGFAKVALKYNKKARKITLKNIKKTL